MAAISNQPGTFFQLLSTVMFTFLFLRTGNSVWQILYAGFDQENAMKQPGLEAFIFLLFFVYNLKKLRTLCVLKYPATNIIMLSSTACWTLKLKVKYNMITVRIISDWTSSFELKTVQLNLSALLHFYRQVRSYPRHAFKVDDGLLTLSELGLTNKQEALFLELI